MDFENLYNKLPFDCIVLTEDELFKFGITSRKNFDRFLVALKKGLHEVTEHIPAQIDFSDFNIQIFEGKIFVSYEQPTSEDEPTNFYPDETFIVQSKPIF